MYLRTSNRFRPQLDVLEDRCSPATLTIAPYSDPTTDAIVLRITDAARPGLTTAQAHTGVVVQWSLADAQAAAFSSDSAAPFEATGRLTSLSFHGNHRLGPVEGSATQLGQFTGNLDARVTRLGADETATGTLTLTATNGDTLVVSFNMVRDRGADSFVGTYSVASGTGRFADASGQGTITLTPQPDLTADFTLDGWLRL